MQQNDRNFSMEDAMRLANTPAGQQLIALLRSNNNPALNQAMEQAKKGDYTQAKEVLAPLLASQEVRNLLQQLGGKNG